ncbi:hypothetical protein [Pseudarthrobacter siccitolerans]|nr:hypothetical protein [Pseudarthrobacter siccitolerans]
MNNVPIMLFQAGATAIPTLLIAIAVGLKQGAAQAEAFESSSKPMKIVTVFFGVVLILSLVCGELAAITALYHGEGDVFLAKLVCIAITNCLGILAFEFLQPLAEAMPVPAALSLLIVAFLSYMYMVVYIAWLL